jgi:hypothetical protein
MRTTCIFAALALLLAGCSSTAGKGQPISATLENTPIGTATIPVSDAQAPASPAEKVALNEAPLPVYSSPKLVLVHLAAYINDKGEAFPETYKYVLEDGGHWNIDALNHPERAYIPAENSLKPQAAPNVLWGTIAPGTVAPPAPADQVPTRKLFDMDQVRITGFFDRADEPKAREEADRLGGNFGTPVVIYDNDLGWIIVPQSALTPVAGISHAGPIQVAPSTTPSPQPTPNADNDVR